MKLVYLANEINGTTGLERMVTIQTDYFIKEFGYEVDMILMTQASNETKSFFELNERIKLHFFDIKTHHFQDNYHRIVKLNKLLKEIKADIVVVCIDHILGLFLPHFIRGKYKMVFQRHSTKSINLNTLYKFLKIDITNYIKKILINFGGTGYNKFVILSEGHKNDWKHVKNIEIIGNPITIDTNGRISSLDHKTVLAIGRHDPAKGFDMLLYSWQKVVAKHPDWKLKIVGQKTTILNFPLLAEELSIANSVIFQGSTKDISAEYLQASILACSSRIEGFPLVLMEAMAFGVPVVSFDCNYGPKTIISDREDGILVPLDDIQSLADGICNLIENESIRKQYGHQAKINIQRYAPDIIMAKWKQLFENLVASNS